MALTIINQPVGHKLIDNELSAVVNPSGDDALFTTAFAHGLVNGDYVYIQSNIESYNGFKYVDNVTYNSFKARNSGSEYVPFKQAVSVIYRVSVLQHGWQCVHLPIVYELESNIYPNNVPDTPHPIASQADNLGYTELTLSTPMIAPVALDFIILIGDGDLDGVYQIREVVSVSVIVINLAYKSGNPITGYTLSGYYNNYCANIKVYAGLPSNHRWQGEKPYELAATLKLIPDSNNQIKFSISEILRGYIETRNNLALDTLPNNLDFFVAFYIVISESYDQSDGTEISTFNSTDQGDNFTGVAVNAKLPFKDENISFLSEYITEDVYLAKWLVTQTSPIAIVGRFFDISFLLIHSGADVSITQNGIEIMTIENPGFGVIRVPLEFDEAGAYCIQASTLGAPLIPGTTSSVSLPPLSSGVNIAGSNHDWTTGANPSVEITGNGTQNSDPWANDFSFIVGNSYTFTPNLSYSIDVNTITASISFEILDSSNSVLYSSTSGNLSGSGNYTTPITFLAPAGAVKYGFRVTTFSVFSSTNDIGIVSVTATTTTPDTPAVPAQTLTEELCITVLEECDDTIIPEEDEIRLTEDGDFRILE